jgi:hypothetical protein
MCITGDAVNEKRHFNMQHICSTVMLFIAFSSPITPYVMQEMDKKLKKWLKK